MTFPNHIASGIFSQSHRRNKMIKEKRNYLILAAAFTAFVLSIYLYFTGQTQDGIFTGIWVPSIVGFGIFVNLITRKK